MNLKTKTICLILLLRYHKKEIIQKLNFLKEPEINYNQLLNQKIDSDINETNNQNIEEINSQTEEIENYAYQMIPR